MHSRYHGHLADLPMAGKPVRLVVRARRSRCDTVLCGRRILAERFDAKVLAPWARRTARLDHNACHRGAGAGRTARGEPCPQADDAGQQQHPAAGGAATQPPAFRPANRQGIDDWAWRRNQRYGTIICDLERRNQRYGTIICDLERRRTTLAYPTGSPRPRKRG
ncbi:hypothetical protein V5F58_14435 [Xanthobacter autotrophicus]|uniref:hypothetical protein n=1 Tax=Xanthobacter autotrophicus TaxID=280 RepID=UPI003729AEFF